MGENNKKIYIGDTPLRHTEKVVKGEFVTLFGESFYKIQNYDEIEPFFMSLVSSSDHWLFISSTGGLTAGRVSAEQSLFPYYTVDKITENSENTGIKAILHVRRDQRTSIWEPFSERYRDNYRVERNIYKNIPSTMLIFEEINLDLGMTYRYAWRTSEKYGFVKTTWLINSGDLACQVELVDGLQNILPTNVTMVTQLTFGSLLDAYKRSELDPHTGLAIFALNSTLTDLPEPSESLMATTVAQLGLDHADYLLSSVQLERFRQGKGVATETEVRGRRGAYFVHAVLELAPQAEYTWHLLADVTQDSAAIAQKIKQLQSDRASLCQDLEHDIAASQLNLRKIVASADGLQLSNDLLCTAHHFSNVMFNVMRGGILADQYWINAIDFIEFVSIRNRSVLQENREFFAALPTRVQVSELKSRADAYGTADLIRLSYTYIPMIFSRRHGDPSRPWNRFSIKLKNPDGSLRLDYEGNWRDIFQNWEAIAYSYPEFVENMISTFLNATTADGYNPYRITYQGVDWEIPEPGNPWANIGYWSDHQIIYLQKLMEISARVHPGELQGLLNRPLFSYSHVPYQIKPYMDMLKDPFKTIIFDWDLERQIEGQLGGRGTDGKLVHMANGQILLVSLTEKLLTLLLAKLANFVPEGGIWMNTQRPEWNDANNALVGKGLSVVTLCYLRRHIAFCRELFSNCTLSAVSISTEVYQFYAQVSEILNRFRSLLQGSFTDKQRFKIMNALGEAGSEYRWNFYNNGFSGEHTQLESSGLLSFLDLVQQYIEHSLHANKRSDNLYHAYNILHLDGERACINPLYEMLEGQVAVLSSGLLSGEESLALLQSLKHGPLYQADPNSYILYPDRDLPGFLERNSLTEDKVHEINLFTTLIDAKDKTLITEDINGIYHFNGHFRNASDVSKALEALKQDPQYKNLVMAESKKILDLFEETFHHDEFTGRSGTFFAYEGLGSVYWHMVSKLLLAVQETILRFKDHPSVNALIERYVDIRAGLGFNKPPDRFGAFPTDPYSHTPKGQGAKQPGMTGLVKEEILTRMVELGIYIHNGQLIVDPFLLDQKELLNEPSVFSWLDVAGQTQSLELAPGSLAYTFCQVPIILQASQHSQIEVFRADSKIETIAGQALDDTNSQHIFARDGVLHHLCVYFKTIDKKRGKA
jgi:hypothetical protein